MSDIESTPLLHTPRRQTRSSANVTPSTPSNRQTPSTSSSRKKSTPKQVTGTRQSNDVYGLLGKGITNDDAEMKGIRLPTTQQVIRCLMFHIDDGNGTRSKWQAASIVLEQCKTFYDKGNIPMITDRKCCEKMLDLLTENAKIRSVPYERRNTPTSMARFNKMEKCMLQTFQLWPAGAEKTVTNPEDRAFLISMMSDRSATFGSRDTILVGKVKRRLIREDAEVRRVEKHNSMDINLETQCDYDISSDSETESEFTSKKPRNHHRKTRVGTDAFIPHDIMKRPSVVAMATRMQITPAQQAAYTEALIQESGGDARKVAISYANADRSRRDVIEKIANGTKRDWSIPKLATIHWDSKLMPELTNKYVNEERLTVVVGDRDELKLLGVPRYQPGTDQSTGDIIANLTSKLLYEWKCVDAIVNMTFDTTASNTGHVTAACVMLQQQLDKAMLWTGCRHHVGEIILTHIFNDLKIEASKSPEVSLFIRFRTNFDSLPHNSTENLSLFNPSQFDTDALNLLTECKESLIQISKSELELRRDDYKEFVELSVLYLTGHTDSLTFKRPGALHKARWMAKLLYSLKIALFQQHIDELPTGTITTKQQTDKIRDFVTFVTHIYCKWWVTCASAVDAPWHDLQLYHLLLRYKIVNSLISASAIKALQRHLWFLTAEMVPLSLFSEQVPTTEKRAVADKLLGCKPDTPRSVPQERYGTGYGKPTFPILNETTKLADLIGPDSWFLFHILQLDDSFLTVDVSKWSDMESYTTSVKNVRSINVINDCAERGVKLSSDFLNSAKTEHHYQNVLQVVEANRKQCPNIRKRTRKP